MCWGSDPGDGSSPGSDHQTRIDSRGQKMRTPFTGVGTALITPFTKDGALDESAVKRLAKRQIDGGVHFLSPCGTTGEAPTLTHRDKLRVVELVVEESNGRLPVLAGAGGYD